MLVGTAYQYLSKKFEDLGERIVEYNQWFLILPTFLSIILATGLQNMQINIGELAVIPTGGFIQTYKPRLIKLFPIDVSTEFEPGRSLESVCYGTVIVETVDKDSIFEESVFEEIIRLDELIRNFTVDDDGEWTYRDICAKSEGKCIQNHILLLKNKMKEIENKTFLLEYSLENISKNNGVLSLGGTMVNKRGQIISARTVRLFYFLDNGNERKEILVKKWERKFVKLVEEYQFKNIKISKDISSSREDSKLDLLMLCIEYIPYSVLFLVLFTVLSSLSPDFLRSKPWTGIMSAIATGMSVVSGFGLLIYIGINFTATSVLVPFIILGIGMDDTFVMMSAWKKTNMKKNLKERMAETYSESGVSITVTSLTNIASFVMGTVVTNIPFYRIFCLYMVLCLIFDYIYQITFVGAILALCGKAEERRLHSFVFLPLDKFSSSDKKNFHRSILCYVQSEENTTSHNIAIITNNLWENLGLFMTKAIVKISVIFLYILYLCVAIWGFTKCSSQASLHLTLIEGSYRHTYLKQTEKYYYQYQYRLQLFITEEVDYSSPEVQRKIEEMMKNLESDPLIAGSLFTESWLRSYLQFLSDRRTSLFLTEYNVSKSEDFISVLRHFFFRIPRAKRFKHDIAFDVNKTKIISSRFLFQTNITRDGNHFYHQLINFKKKLNVAPYSVIVYHPLFYYFDMIDAIPGIAKQTLSIVFCAVLIVCFILLPNFICVICVSFSIISVGGGVMGFMFLWDCTLNTNSITVFIMVLGFSVDYAAHVSCAYVSIKDVPNNRLVRAIVMTGFPIMQGCLTTILSVAVCALAPNFELRNTVKIISLSCLIGALHGIIFVPVGISLLDSLSHTIFYKKKKSDEVNKNNNKILEK